MHPILFTLGLLSIFALLNFYVYKRLIFHLAISQKQKQRLLTFLHFNLFGIFLYALGRYYIEFPNSLYFLFSVPIGIIFLLVCTTLIYDILHSLLKRVPLQPKRRKFFKQTLDLSSFAIASSLTLRSLYEASTLTLEEKHIKIKNLQKEYTLVQLSDIHIGGLIDAHYIQNVVKRVNALHPDLVVITGDLVDIDIHKAAHALQALQNLQSKYGTFFIVGNHEYFHDIQAIIKRVKTLGIHVLENNSYYVGERGKGFNLVGVYDLFGYRVNRYVPDLTKALSQRELNAPTILLAHQPKFLQEVHERDEIALMLSGHTHGGQLFPFQALVKLQQPYVSGLHQHTQTTQIYVSKGTGFWGPPMRLGAKAEITKIVLSP